MQRSASCFPHHNCGVPVCKYDAERRIISKNGDEFKNYCNLQGDQKILKIVSGT